MNRIDELLPFKEEGDATTLVYYSDDSYRIVVRARSSLENNYFVAVASCECASEFIYTPEAGTPMDEVVQGISVLAKEYIVNCTIAQVAQWKLQKRYVLH